MAEFQYKLSSLYFHPIPQLVFFPLFNQTKSQDKKTPYRLVS